MTLHRPPLSSQKITTMKLFLIALALFITECSNPILVKRQTELTASQSAAWLSKIKALAKNGDWLAIRGYHETDHLVAIATAGDLSHVAVYDAENEEVIEAVSPRVRSLKLSTFISNAHKIVLIRPKNWSEEAGIAAVTKARSKIGVPYDFLGTVGLPSKGRFYCSELAAWSIGQKVDQVGVTKVFAPKDSPKLGEVLFDSGDRY